MSLAALTTLAALTNVGVAAENSRNDLPDIGTPADQVMSRSDEYNIGLMVIRGLRDQGQILDDPEIADYIQSLGARIAAQTGDGGHNFQYFVIKEPDINAFALPGGFICVNQGLVLATANESQLASVLAHETAHVTQRHIARQIRQQGRTGLASAAALLAAILIGAAGGGGGAVEGAIAIAQGAAQQQSINFTRSNEQEADRVGIGFLAAAGFDPQGMPDFFEAIGRRNTLQSPTQYIPALLQDHPVTSDRIAESRERAGQYPRTKKPESFTYAFARERLRVVAASADQDLRPYYSTRRQDRALTPAERYGEALAISQAGDRAAAEGTLRELAKKFPTLPLLQSALGQTQDVEGHSSDALATLANAVNVSPRNVPLSVRYAEALMRGGHNKEAHELLLDLFNNVPPTPSQIRLIALAASAAGNSGDAYFYMGEYHLSSGDLPMAVNQLELALSAPGITPVQRARYAARMKEVRDALQESRAQKSRQRTDAANIAP